MDEEQTPVEDKDALEADGYYGDDEADGEELDLSFLDEEDESESEKHVK